MDARLPAGPDQPAGAQRSARPPAGTTRSLDPGVERRLAALETRLDDLDEAIREVLPAAIGQMVETACREAVADEMRQVSENLRRSVSELGRLLLRDLDRLTKLLADHRDAIVQRLTGPLPGPGDDLWADEDPEAYVFDPPEEQDEAAEDTDDGGPEQPAALTGEEGRWRVLPGRRRARSRHGQGAS